MDETNVIETTQETFNKDTEVKELTDMKEFNVEETVHDESNLFRLDEMSDAIDMSMSNIKEVYEKQEKLINILEALNNEELAELISSMKDQVNYMKAQYKELEARKMHLNYALACCKDDKNTSILIDKLLLGLGIFKNN